MHWEWESWALIFSLRVALNTASAVSDDFLAYVETHAYSLLIYFLSTLDFSKQMEYFAHFILCYSFPFILNLDIQHLFFEVIGGFYTNVFFVGKL